jgi:hypothetical protein
MPTTPASAPLEPTQQHAEADSRENGSSQSLAVGNRNEMGLLITYFDDSHRNSPGSSTAAPAFTPRTGIAHTTRTGPCSVAIDDFCHRDDRIAMGASARGIRDNAETFNEPGGSSERRCVANWLMAQGRECIFHFRARNGCTDQALQNTRVDSLFCIPLRAWRPPATLEALS